MKIELSLIIRICIEVKPGKMTGKESYYTFVCVCVCTDIQKGFWQQQRRVNMERATPVLYKYLPVSVAMHYYYRAVEG